MKKLLDKLTLQFDDRVKGIFKSEQWHTYIYNDYLILQWIRPNNSIDPFRHIEWSDKFGTFIYDDEQETRKCQDFYEALELAKQRWE